MLIIGSTPAGASGLRPVSSADLDPSDALLLTFPPLLQFFLYHQLLCQRPLFQAVLFRRRRCHRLCLHCRSFLASLLAGLRLTTCPGMEHLLHHAHHLLGLRPYIREFCFHVSHIWIQHLNSMRSASIIHLQAKLLLEGHWCVDSLRRSRSPLPRADER